MTHITNENLITLLDLARNFTSGKEDVRIYLRDVIVKRNSENSIDIVAANGHMLIKINIADLSIPNSIPARITAQSIKDAAKVQRIDLLEASYNETPYPDYDRLIPSERGATIDNGLPKINASYLAVIMTAYSKAMRKLISNKFAGIELLTTSEQGATLFHADINDNITAQFVVMPMRK